MNVFNLFAKLTLDKSDYDKNIEDAQNKQQEFKENTEETSKASILAWGKVAAAIAAVAVAVGVINGVAMASINLADSFDEMAERTGMSTTALQEYNYIAIQTGLTMETMLGAMARMNNAALSNEAAFKKIGVSVKDSNGNLKEQNALFDEVIGALGNITNEGDKTAAMLSIFGRGATQMGEVLRLGADGLKAFKERAHELGVVMEDDIIKSSATFSDTLTDMGLRFKTIVASMLAGKEESKEQLDMLMQDIVSFFEGYLPVFVQFGVKLLVAVVQGIIKALPQLGAISGVIVQELITAIFSINWFEVGWNIIKGIFTGFANGISALFGGGRKNDNFVSTTENLAATMQSAVIQSNTTNGLKQEVDINLNVSGDTPTDEDTAEKIADAIYPLIDKKLGGLV